MKKLDLTAQFVVYLAIILVAVLGAMNYWFYHDHTRHLDIALEDRAAAKLDVLESSVSYYMIHFENELIQELGNKTVADRDVVFLSINGAQGDTFFVQGDARDQESRRFTRRITADKEYLGSVSLALDTRELTAEHRESIFYAIGLLLLSMTLIGGMIYLFFHRQILSEVNRAQREKELLREEYDFFTTVINTTSNMVMVLDSNGYIMLLNRACADALGGTEHELLQQHLPAVVDIQCGDQVLESRASGDEVSGFKAFSAALLGKNCRSVISTDEGQLLVEWKFEKLDDEQGCIKFLIGSGIDITRQHRIQRELDHRAHHDVLTALPNRTLFNDRLQESFKQAKRYSSLFSLLFIDLDEFKPVNDRFGHEAGDRVLKIVAQRMQKAVRELDTVARLGGDEFGILLHNVKTRENVYQLAGRLLEEISVPIAYGNEMLTVGASIGIAFYNQDVRNAKDLIKMADAAMYRAKDAGRNTWRCADESPRLASVTDLKRGD